MGREASAGATEPEVARSGAAAIFTGFGVGLVYKLAMEAFKLWKDTPEKVFGAPLAAGSISAEISPELLGVGYIIGPRIAATMAAGGVLAYLVLIPAIQFFGSAAAVIIAPGTMPIAQMSPGRHPRRLHPLHRRRRGGRRRDHQPGPGPADDLARPRRRPRRLARQRRARPRRRADAAHRPDLSLRFVALGLVVLVAAHPDGPHPAHEPRRRAADRRCSASCSSPCRRG